MQIDSPPEYSIRDHTIVHAGPVPALLHSTAANTMARALLALAGDGFGQGAHEHIVEAALCRAYDYAHTAQRLSRHAVTLMSGAGAEPPQDEELKARRTVEEVADLAQEAGLADLIRHRDDVAGPYAPAGGPHSDYHGRLEAELAGQAVLAATEQVLRPLSLDWENMDWEVRDGAIGGMRLMVEELAEQLELHGADARPAAPEHGVSELQMRMFRVRSEHHLERARAQISLMAERHHRQIRHYDLCPEGALDSVARFNSAPLNPMTMRTMLLTGPPPAGPAGFYVVRHHSVAISLPLDAYPQMPFSRTALRTIFRRLLVHAALDLQEGRSPDSRAVAQIEEHMIHTERGMGKPSTKRARADARDVRHMLGALKKDPPDAGRLPVRIEALGRPTVHLTPVGTA